MATFKAEVYAHQKRDDGTYNIKIRVTHNRRKKYLPTVWYVSKDDLTRSLKIKNQKYIDLTDDLIKKYRGICANIGDRLKGMSVEQVVDCIAKGDSNEHFDLDIVQYGLAYIKHLQETGHKGTASNYRVAINNLIKFVGREQISIKEITVNFINDWIEWIRSTPSQSSRRKGDRAPSLYLTQIRALYNRAKVEYNDEEAGIIRLPYSPFNKIVFPKQPTTRKRALSIEKLRKIAELPYTLIRQYDTTRFNMAKDVFMLSFGLIGMNAVDLYGCTDCKNGRLTYERTKTRTRRADHAEISIKIQPELEALVKKYRDPSGRRVFRFYQMYSSPAYFTKALNKGLKQIGEAAGISDLEFYAARHTWATIALNDAGVDKYTVHAALNHVDDSMKVTDIYIKKSWEPIDHANRLVLDLVKLDLSNVQEYRKKDASQNKVMDD